MYPLLPLTSVFQTTLVCKFWPKEYFISKESCWKAWIHYSNFYDLKLKQKLFQQKTRETLTNCNLYNQTEFISAESHGNWYRLIIPISMHYTEIQSFQKKATANCIDFNLYGSQKFQLKAMETKPKRFQIYTSDTTL